MASLLRPKGRPRSKELPSEVSVHWPFSGANHRSLVQRRGETLPFPYACLNCGAAIIEIKPYQFKNRRFFCPSCHREQIHSAYLKYRDIILARQKENYDATKKLGPVAASVLTRKMRVLRAVVAGGLDKITGQEDIRCSNCGCDDILFLEVNHRNGGGSQEARARGRMTTLGQSIAKGRSVHDLSILCGPCNRLEYLKRRYPGRTYPQVSWHEGVLGRLTTDE